jgi:hypothetical protein
MGATRKKTRRLDKTRTSTASKRVADARQEILFQKELIKALRATAGKIPRIEKIF